MLKPQTPTPELVQALKDRIDQLEAEIRTLKGQKSLTREQISAFNKEVMANNPLIMYDPEIDSYEVISARP